MTVKQLIKHLSSIENQERPIYVSICSNSNKCDMEYKDCQRGRCKGDKMTNKEHKHRIVVCTQTPVLQDGCQFKQQE